MLYVQPASEAAQQSVSPAWKRRTEGEQVVVRAQREGKGSSVGEQQSWPERFLNDFYLLFGPFGPDQLTGHPSTYSLILSFN